MSADAAGIPVRAYDWQKLKSATEALFVAMGASQRSAALIADHLIAANLTGHDSHGIGMIPGYDKGIARGDLRLTQELRVALDTPTLVICDGNQGPGQVMAHDAMAIGIARAKTNGSCIIGLRDSYHIGRIGHWAEQCAAAGLVSVHFVNVVSFPVVVPFGGRQPRLATNPFAAGFPRGDGGPPVIADFATSALALGKVRVAYNKGVPVPENVIVDAAGEPTTDPSVMFTEPMGSLLAFGGHKGSALSLTCELLGAALFGGTVQDSPEVRSVILNSMFSVLVDPAVLGLAADYAERQAAAAGWFGSEPGVKLPGDVERETRAARMADGIPLDDTTMDQIRQIATDRGVDTAGFTP
jgi:uncharacterized oxidoreductase